MLTEFALTAPNLYEKQQSISELYLTIYAQKKMTARKTECGKLYYQLTQHLWFECQSNISVCNYTLQGAVIMMRHKSQSFSPSDKEIYYELIYKSAQTKYVINLYYITL